MLQYLVDELVGNRNSFIGETVKVEGILSDYEITPTGGFFNPIGVLILTLKGQNHRLKAFAPVNRLLGEHEDILPYLKANLNHLIETDILIKDKYNLVKLFFPSSTFKFDCTFK